MEFSESTLILMAKAHHEERRVNSGYFPDVSTKWEELPVASRDYKVHLMRVAVGEIQSKNGSKVDTTEVDEFYSVEQVEPGLFQSVFPSSQHHLSRLHTSVVDAFAWMNEQRQNVRNCDKPKIILNPPLARDGDIDVQGYAAEKE